MAESVTPEASKFWRNHVLDLQAKLRALHEKDTGKNSQILRGTKTDDIIKNNERLMASLWENTSYVPPNQEDIFSNASMNNSIVESKGPSIAESNGVSALRSPTNRAVYIPEMGFPMVDVVAPADLPGGYQFEAQINNKHFLATVPAGGIRKGQTFSCLMKEMRDSDIPVGRWKDGLFDCFHYGIAHPMLLNSILCPLIALSQVEGREELDVLGRRVAPGTPQTGIYSTRGTMILVLVLWVFLNTVIISGFELKLHNYVSPSPPDIISLVLVNGFMIFFTIYATINTRTYIREKYHIEEDKKQSRFRDIMSAIFCLPLTIAQMGRHTAPYEEHMGACCNDTGVGLSRNTDGTIV
jgi:Cys-rich protein (TIGR01571 family)